MGVEEKKLTYQLENLRKDKKYVQKLRKNVTNF